MPEAVRALTEVLRKMGVDVFREGLLPTSSEDAQKAEAKAYVEEHGYEATMHEVEALKAGIRGLTAMADAHDTPVLEAIGLRAQAGADRFRVALLEKYAAEVARTKVSA